MKRMMVICAALVICARFVFASGGSEAPAAAAPAGPKTKVLLWNIIFEDWNRKYCEDQAAKFNAESKTVELTQEFIPGDAWNEKFTAAQAAGTAPDSWLTNYANIPWCAMLGMVQPLDDLIPKGAWNDLYDNVKEMVSYKGKYYAYPQLLEPATVLFYRKDLFQAGGLDPNKPPKTWDELIAYAKKLGTDKVFGVNFPGFGAEVGWSTWGWQKTASGHLAITDDWGKATVQDQGYVDLANFIKRLYTEKVVPQQPLGGYTDILPFCDGGLAMAFCGSWAIGQIRNTYPDLVDKVGVAAPPTKDGKPFQSTLGGWTYLVDAKAKQPKAAAEYIAWLLGSDPARPAEFFGVAGYSKYSPRKSVDAYIKQNTAGAKDPWMKVVSEQIVPYGISEPIYAWDISMAVAGAFESVVLNKVSAEEALAKAADTINAYIATNDYKTKKP